MNKENIFQKFKEDENVRNRFILLVVVFIGVVAVAVNIGNVKNKMAEPLEDKQQKSIDNLYAKYEELKKEGKIVDDNSSTKDSYGATEQTSDTDGDGINDYDETNIFGTSVYLKDSDGDGINDYDEIKNGTDPNCVSGKSCDTSVSTVAANTNANTDNLINGVDVNSLDIAKVREELKNIAPDSVKATVDTMTDEQVRTVFVTLYKESKASSSEKDVSYINELKQLLPTFTSVQISKMQDMKESEIRDLLLDTGIADNILLSKFKDGELKSTVLSE